jgi:hypothetical protein
MFDMMIDLTPYLFTLPRFGFDDWASKIGFEAPPCLRFKNFPLDGEHGIKQRIGKVEMQYLARVPDDRTWTNFYNSFGELTAQTEELGALLAFLPALASRLAV